MRLAHRCNGAPHHRHPFGIGWMRAEELVARIRDAVEEFRPPQGAVSCVLGDFGAKCVGLQFKFLGETPRADGRTEFLRALHRPLPTAPDRNQNPCQKGPLRRAALHLRQMPEDVMRRLMPDDEGDLVNITRIRNEAQREAQNRAAIRPKRLKGIRGLIGAIIDHDPEVAGNTARAFAAEAFRDGFHRADGGDEIPRRHIRPRPRPDHRRSRRAGGGHRIDRHHTARQKQRANQRGKSFHGGGVLHLMQCSGSSMAAAAEKAGSRACAERRGCYPRGMFTIEHEFDATVITLIDEGASALAEDVTISAFEDCVTLEQVDALTGEPVTITLSMAQLRDLMAALDLPEGSYRLIRPEQSNTP